MTTEPKPKKSNAIKVILLIVGGLVALCLIVMIFGYIYGQTPQYKKSVTETSAWKDTLTAWPTNTLLPTVPFTPTLTPTDTLTPTSTFTPLPPSTQTALSVKATQTSFAENKRATSEAYKATLTAIVFNAKATTDAKRTETAIVLSQTPTSTATKTIMPAADNSVKAIMDGTGLSQMDSEAIFEVIKSVGFENVGEVLFNSESETEKAYILYLNCTTASSTDCAEHGSLWMVGNKVENIYWSSLTLYDSGQGGVLDKITNYVLTSNDISSFEEMTIENVKSALKSPSTASFPSTIFSGQWGVSRTKDIVSVQSYVDAENSFGAMIRSNFTAQYSYASQSLLYLEVGGSVAYGSIQKP